MTCLLKTMIIRKLLNTVYDKKNIAGEVSFILISDFGAVFAKKFSESELLNYECKN